MISEISTVKELGEFGVTIILIMGLVVFTVLIIYAFFLKVRSKEQDNGNS